MSVASSLVASSFASCAIAAPATLSWALAVASALTVAAPARAAEGSAPRAAAAAPLRVCTEVASAVSAVTVYPDTALVTRAATFAGGDGRYVLGGLPASLDASSVRVRVAGGELVSLDQRERAASQPPAGRIAELSAELEASAARRIDLEDRLLVQQTLDRFLHDLLESTARPNQGAQASTGASTASPAGVGWDAHYAQLETRLAANALARRALTREIDALDKQQRALRAEMGELDRPSRETTRELVLDVVATSAAPLHVEVDYLIGGAGWAPQYDLRADADLRAVDLSYRARIWQQSGEDWSDCAIALSTAQPRRGAQGPEPCASWLRIFDITPREREDKKQALRSLGYADANAPTLAEAGAATDAAPKPTPYASVSAQGLSLRYELARKETVESRSEPTQVLVGRAHLSIEAEHVCVPALDTSVWLRALAKNTSEWVLLPGPAAVYFGADYVGPASIATVQRDEEFTLHLGVDPNWKIERTKLVNTHEQGGLFSSRQTARERWKLSARNLGSPGGASDGSVVLLVREALPRSGDERISIELDDPRPKPSDAPRWKKERDENGILTWELRVARGATATLEWGTQASWPEGLRVARG